MLTVWKTVHRKVQLSPVSGAGLSLPSKAQGQSHTWDVSRWWNLHVSSVQKVWTRLDKQITLDIHGYILYYLYLSVINQPKAVLWCVGWWLSHISCIFKASHVTYQALIFGDPSSSLQLMHASEQVSPWWSPCPFERKHIFFHTQTQPCSVAHCHSEASRQLTQKIIEATRNKSHLPTSNQNVQAVKLSFLCCCSHASFTVAANAFCISLRCIRQSTLTCDTGNQGLQTPEFWDWTVGTLWVLYWCAFCRWLYIYHIWNNFAIIIYNMYCIPILDLIYFVKLLSKFLVEVKQELISSNFLCTSISKRSESGPISNALRSA